MNRYFNEKLFISNCLDNAFSDITRTNFPGYKAYHNRTKNDLIQLIFDTKLDGNGSVDFKTLDKKIKTMSDKRIGKERKAFFDILTYIIGYSDAFDEKIQQDKNFIQFGKKIRALKRCIYQNTKLTTLDLLNTTELTPIQEESKDIIQKHLTKAIGSEHAIVVQAIHSTSIQAQALNKARKETINSLRKRIKQIKPLQETDTIQVGVNILSFAANLIIPGVVTAIEHIQGAIPEPVKEQVKEKLQEKLKDLFSSHEKEMQLNHFSTAIQSEKILEIIESIREDFFNILKKPEIQQKILVKVLKTLKNELKGQLLTEEEQQKIVRQSYKNEITRYVEYFDNTIDSMLDAINNTLTREVNFEKKYGELRILSKNTNEEEYQQTIANLYNMEQKLATQLLFGIHWIEKNLNGNSDAQEIIDRYKSESIIVIEHKFKERTNSTWENILHPFTDLEKEKKEEIQKWNQYQNEKLDLILLDYINSHPNYYAQRKQFLTTSTGYTLHLGPTPQAIETGVLYINQLDNSAIECSILMNKQLHVLKLDNELSTEMENVFNKTQALTTHLERKLFDSLHLEPKKLNNIELAHNPRHPYNLEIVNSSPKNEELKPNVLYVYKNNENITYKSINPNNIIESGLIATKFPWPNQPLTEEQKNKFYHIISTIPLFNQRFPLSLIGKEEHKPAKGYTLAIVEQCPTKLHANKLYLDLSSTSFKYLTEEGAHELPFHQLDKNRIKKLKKILSHQSTPLTQEQQTALESLVFSLLADKGVYKKEKYILNPLDLSVADKNKPKLKLEQKKDSLRYSIKGSDVSYPITEDDLEEIGIRYTTNADSNNVDIIQEHLFEIHKRKQLKNNIDLLVNNIKSDNKTHIKQAFYKILGLFGHEITEEDLNDIARCIFADPQELHKARGIVHDALEFALKQPYLDPQLQYNLGVVKKYLQLDEAMIVSNPNIIHSVKDSVYNHKLNILSKLTPEEMTLLNEMSEYFKEVEDILKKYEEKAELCIRTDKKTIQEEMNRKKILSAFFVNIATSLVIGPLVPAISKIVNDIYPQDEISKGIKETFDRWVGKSEDIVQKLRLRTIELSKLYEGKLHDRWVALKQTLPDLEKLTTFSELRNLNLTKYGITFENFNLHALESKLQKLKNLVALRETSNPHLKSIFKELAAEDNKNLIPINQILELFNLKNHNLQTIVPTIKAMGVQNEYIDLLELLLNASESNQISSETLNYLSKIITPFLGKDANLFSTVLTLAKKTDNLESLLNKIQKVTGEPHLNLDVIFVKKLLNFAHNPNVETLSKALTYEDRLNKLPLLNIALKAAKTPTLTFAEIQSKLIEENSPINFDLFEKEMGLKSLAHSLGFSPDSVQEEIECTLDDLSNLENLVNSSETLLGIETVNIETQEKIKQMMKQPPTNMQMEIQYLIEQFKKDILEHLNQEPALTQLINREKVNLQNEIKKLNESLSPEDFTKELTRRVKAYQDHCQERFIQALRDQIKTIEEQKEQTISNAKGILGELSSIREVFEIKENQNIEDTYKIIEKMLPNEIYTSKLMSEMEHVKSYMDYYKEDLIPNNVSFLMNASFFYGGAVDAVQKEFFIKSILATSIINEYQKKYQIARNEEEKHSIINELSKTLELPFYKVRNTKESISVLDTLISQLPAKHPFHLCKEIKNKQVNTPIKPKETGLINSQPNTIFVHKINKKVPHNLVLMKEKIKIAHIKLEEEINNISQFLQSILIEYGQIMKNRSSADLLVINTVIHEITQLAEELKHLFDKSEKSDGHSKIDLIIKQLNESRIKEPNTLVPIFNALTSLIDQSYKDLILSNKNSTHLSSSVNLYAQQEKTIHQLIANCTDRITTELDKTIFTEKSIENIQSHIAIQEFAQLIRTQDQFPRCINEFSLKEMIEKLTLYSNSIQTLEDFYPSFGSSNYNTAAQALEKYFKHSLDNFSLKIKNNDWTRTDGNCRHTTITAAVLLVNEVLSSQLWSTKYKEEKLHQLLNQNIFKYSDQNGNDKSFIKDCLDCDPRYAMLEKTLQREEASQYDQEICTQNKRF